MSNETTSTTLTEIINSEWIRSVFQRYVREYVNASRFCLTQSLVGKGTPKWAQPIMVSDMGTVGDGGTGVDTEYNGTEGTDLSNIQLDLGEATVTSAEYGILRTITDTSMEDVVDGFAMVKIIAEDAAEILATAIEDDVIALFSSVTGTTGSTGVNITVANLTDGIAALRNRGCRAPGGLVAVLSDTQIGDCEDAFEATNAAAAVYAQAVDRLHNVQPGAANGINDGHVFSFRGVPFFQSGLVDTANTAADDVGCVWVRGDVPSNEPYAGIGMSISRPFRIATQRDESLRATEVVCTRRAGVGLLQNNHCQAYVTDA